MQRSIRLLIICMLVVVAFNLVTTAQETSTPDFGATATAIIRDATHAAATQEAVISSTPTQDPYLMTVTAQIRAVTQTAEALTGNTAVPINSESQNGDYSLTATELVLQATTAAGDVANTADESPNGSVLSQTLLAFGALIVILLVLGAGVFYLSHRNHH